MREFLVNAMVVARGELAHGIPVCKVDISVLSRSDYQLLRAASCVLHVGQNHRTAGAEITIGRVFLSDVEHCEVIDDGKPAALCREFQETVAEISPGW
jgi:hypothetical protein